MNRVPFPEAAARELVSRALAEDLGQGGDRTSVTLIPAGTQARGLVVAREPLVVAGLPLAPLVLEQMAARGAGAAQVEPLVEDGAVCSAGQPLARLVGSAHALLGGERLLLNLLSRLSGIATLTARCVEEIAGTGARVADTRKTTPGLRLLEKYAVAVGGGENHRLTLDELILVKDNHKLLAGGLPGVIAALRAAGHDLAAVEVEVDTLAEFDVALAAGVGWILLDNFDPAMVREAARRAGGRTRLEASGGLRPGKLRPFAEAGVKRLSLGTLTHGVRSVDIALDFEPRP